MEGELAGGIGLVTQAALAKTAIDTVSKVTHTGKPRRRKRKKVKAYA